MATYNMNYDGGNNFIAPPNGYSVYIVDGGAGTDTFFADAKSTSFTISAMDSTGVTSISGASGTTIKLSNVETISFKDGKSFTLQTLSGSGNTPITGTVNNDALSGTAGNDIIDGSYGIDTLLLGSVSKASAGLMNNGSNWTLYSPTTGTDTLSNVERIQFQGTNVALDLDGHAGQVAKLLGAVFGAANVANKVYAGVGLAILDNGMSYEGLAGAAVAFAGANTHSAIVDLLWTNIVGTAPTAAQAQPFVNLLDSGFDVGTLTAVAADTSINQNNINLVGLAQTGLEYV